MKIEAQPVRSLPSTTRRSRRLQRELADQKIKQYPPSYVSTAPLMLKGNYVHTMDIKFIFHMCFHCHQTFTFHNPYKIYNCLINFLSKLLVTVRVKLINHLPSFHQRFHAFGHQSLWMLVWVFPRPMGESDISTNFFHPFAINSQKGFVLFSHNLNVTNA